MKFEWNDSLSIDGGVIDEDHKFLIVKIFELLDCVRQKEEKELILDKLNVIRIFAKEHFRREEALQQAAGFDDHERHKGCHSNLLDMLMFNTRRILIDYSCNDNGESMERRLQAIEKFMYKWLIQHIQVEDTRMKPYVSAMRERAGKMSPLMKFVHKLVA